MNNIFIYWGGGWAVQSYLGVRNCLALALALESRVLPVGRHGAINMNILC